MDAAEGVLDVGEDSPGGYMGDDDDVSVPDEISDFQKEWFVAFVKWYRVKYQVLTSKLDFDKIDQLKPEDQTESIFLNFLMFYDKHYLQRATFEVAERDKADHPFMCGTGTDHNFHALGNIFIQYGPNYFLNNTDLKGKTKEEPGGSKERLLRPCSCTVVSSDRKGQCAGGGVVEKVNSSKEGNEVQVCGGKEKSQACIKSPRAKSATEVEDDEFEEEYARDIAAYYGALVAYSRNKKEERAGSDVVEKDCSGNEKACVGGSNDDSKGGGVEKVPSRKEGKEVQVSGGKEKSQAKSATEVEDDEFEEEHARDMAAHYDALVACSRNKKRGREE